MLASLFGSPGGDDVASAANYPGLQTRAGVQSMIQQRIAAGGQGAQDVFKENIKAAQAQLNQYKRQATESRQWCRLWRRRLARLKPNMQKTKTFFATP